KERKKERKKIYIKKTYNKQLKDKYSGTQWHMPVIPAAQEAEAGESPEPRSSRSVWTTQQNPISVSLLFVALFLFFFFTDR
uniref:Uncharacterized protein n=1 Tax=Spermophilus dauricus TaxID=99837 RepID=A0A8C9QQ88_SPEDA